MSMPRHRVDSGYRRASSRCTVSLDTWTDTRTAPARHPEEPT